MTTHYKQVRFAPPDPAWEMYAELTARYPSTLSWMHVPKTNLLCRSPIPISVKKEFKSQRQFGSISSSSRPVHFNIKHRIKEVPTEDDFIMSVTPHDLMESIRAGNEPLIIDARSLPECSTSSVKNSYRVKLARMFMRRLKKEFITVDKIVHTNDVDKFRIHFSTVVSQMDTSPLKDVYCPFVVCYTSMGTCTKGSPTETILQSIAKSGVSVGFVVGGFKAIVADAPGIVETSDNPRPNILSRHFKNPRNPDDPIIPKMESMIRKNLFIGSGANAHDPVVIKKYRITAIVNCTKKIPNVFEKSGVKYMRVSVKDTWRQPISDDFGSTHDFIDQELKRGGTVMVHCMAGISRSSTIVIAYLMKSEGRSFDSVYAEVRGKRKQASPNIDFIGQLLVFERSLNVSIPSRSLAKRTTNNSPVGGETDGATDDAIKYVAEGTANDIAE